jgi:hypothetical protein
MRLHHVNLAVHPDVLDEEMTFLAEGLGLVRVDAPQFPTARWFAFPDGTEVHLSRTEEPILTKPGHVALVVGDAFAATCARLGALGLTPRAIEGLGMDVALYDDPGGHLWELRAA